MANYAGTGLEVFANNPAGNVTAGGTTAPAQGTSQAWTVTVTAAFAVASVTTTPPQFFYACDPVAPSELMLVTVCPGGTGAGQSWTVIRGANNTATVTHQGGFTVTQVMSADSLSNLQNLPWFNMVTLFGADPTGAADCGAAVAAAIAVLPPQGAVLYFPAGKYVNAATTWTINLTASPEQVVTIVGDGMRTTQINYQGTGDCWRIYCSSTGALNYGGSGFRGICIDGTSSGTGACGIHIGDFELLLIEDVQVTNFTGTSAIGIHFENAYTWTEEATVRMSLINNTQNAVFEVTTGNVSWGYSSFDFNVWMKTVTGGGQDGIVLKNGPQLYHGTLRIRGNSNAGTSALTNAVLRISGVTGAGAVGGAGQPSEIKGEQLTVQVEQASGTTLASTIIMDSTAYVRGAYGILDFSFGGGTFVPATLPASGQFQFTGVISGDVNLSPGAAYDKYVWAHTVPVSYGVGISGGNFPSYAGGGFVTFLSDMFYWVLTASINGNVTSSTWNGGATLGASQRVTIIIKQAASGGPYTVTWQHNASPSVTAPTILWAGGTAPVMSTGANAIDVYHLETLDGITWYGRAEQNVS